MNTTNDNGRVQKKTLASQLDRLDNTIDALADGVNRAVVDAVRVAVTTAGPAGRRAGRAGSAGAARVAASVNRPGRSHRCPGHTRTAVDEALGVDEIPGVDRLEGPRFLHLGRDEGPWCARSGQQYLPVGL